MTKSYLLLSLLLTGEVISVKECKSKRDYIIWKSKEQLVWSDFKGQRPDSLLNIAGASVQLRTTYTLADGIKKFDVQCLFFCNKSWRTDTDTTIYLLQHEQGHFDLGEVYARKLRKKLLEMSQQTNILTTKKIDSVCYVYSNALADEQIIYDDETYHSMDISKQIEWNEKIINKLDSLKKYETLKLR